MSPWAGLRAVGYALRHIQHRGYIYIWANLLWVLLSLPLITAPAAWAGLIRLSRRSYQDTTVTLDEFWQGFRENVGRGIVLFFLNVAIIGINVYNLWYYRTFSGLTILGLRWMWVTALVLWIAIQLYLWPLLYELKQPSLWGAFRNAAVMIWRNPLFTLGVIVGSAIIAILSTIIAAAWVVITASTLAAISTGAVLNRLAAAGLRAPLPPIITSGGVYDGADSE